MSLKNTISTIVNESQVAYVIRFISEGGRLVLGDLEITNSLDGDGFLMTADIEKAFDSFYKPFFLIVCFKII